MGLPDGSRLDRRIFKRMIRDHGQLTSADKRALAEDVGQLTWRYALKAGTVQVLPYVDEQREYLEIAIIEALLGSRRRVGRLAEVLHRAIPYPVVLVQAEGEGLNVSVAHKRQSRAERGAVVAEDVIMTKWIDGPPADADEAFVAALGFVRLPQHDFFALYRAYGDLVLAHRCAELSGRFDSAATRPTDQRRKELARCEGLAKEIKALRSAIRSESRFAAQVELNARIKTLDTELTEALQSL